MLGGVGKAEAPPGTELIRRHLLGTVLLPNEAGGADRGYPRGRRQTQAKRARSGLDLQVRCVPEIVVALVAIREVTAE